MTADALQALFATPDTTLPAVADTVLALRGQVSLAEECLEAARQRLARAEMDLARKLAQQGLTTLRHVGMVFSAVESHYYRVPAGTLDNPWFHSWLLAQQGGRDLVTKALDSNGFTKLCRLLVERGKPLHPAVQVAVKRHIRVAEDSHGQTPVSPGQAQEAAQPVQPQPP